MIFDDQGDCSVHYQLPLTYKMNYLDVDAFSSQVTSVSLYVYDTAGNLVLHKTESGELLSQPDYKMDLDILPGTYSMLVWGEGTPDGTPTTSFEIGGGENPVSASDLSASLPLKEDNNGSLYSDEDIVPLFYGYAPEVVCPDTYGYITLPAIDLMKDTNTINVVVESIGGYGIDKDELSVSIQADNSDLDWQNAVVGNKTFSYIPWSVTWLRSDREDNTNATRDDNDAEDNYATGLLAELSLGRLMADRKPMLVVHRNSDNMDIIRLDLVKYLCMVKGHLLAGCTDQQYLDRMDHHSLTFFVDRYLNWYLGMGININGWNVVPEWNVEI